MSKDRWDQVQLLNCVCAIDYRGWQQTRAQKQHIDRFGKIINRGDFHWTSGGFSGDRLTNESMDVFLDLVLGSHNCRTNAYYAAQHLLEKRREEMQKHMNKIDEAMRGSKESTE